MTIKFYGADNKNGFLSNFYPSPFVSSDKVLGSILGSYPTVEHFYQAAKATTTEDAKKIATALTPGMAKVVGQKIKLRGDWEDVVGNEEIHKIFTDDKGVVVLTVKDHYMYAGLIDKFTQNPELAEKLKATGDEYLVENARADYYWGCGSNQSGKNKLGRMLMLVRNNLGRHGF